MLSNFFDIDMNKCLIIPNGVNPEFKYGDVRDSNEKYNLTDFILFVGRIEHRKNVLQLIKAFVKSKLDTHLVIIGKISDPDYYSICKKESNKKVIFLPPIPHESELLRSAYKSAKVVALPSKYETPGLVALEGGLAGANVVVTSVGGTKEYFNEYAWYINPKSEDSIRNALIDAYNSPRNELLSKHIEKKYSWDVVAKKTIEVYDVAMRG
ncbi:MAG: glycosyltransferase [ANME-2 cluster archaeon]|nr:MAG: glycosyltransferase [ANME-2 cluster archaeon]